jgi:hypothetical protein
MMIPFSKFDLKTFGFQCSFLIQNKFLDDLQSKVVALTQHAALLAQV